MGFNSVAGKGSMLDMLPGGKKMRVGAKMLKAGGPRMAQGAKLVGSGMGRLAAPLAGIASAFSEYNEQKDKGDSTEKAALKAGVKGLGTAGGALLGAKGGAMAGASIGALFGGVGAVPGAFIGGLLGSIGGAMAGGYLTDADTYGVNDAIIKFNPQDKIVSMDDGLVASTSKGKIDELVQGRGTKKQKIEFGKLDIGGKITLEMPGATTMDIDLTREPEFVRKLSTMIQEQLRTNLAGGKLSPNPIPRYDN